MTTCRKSQFEDGSSQKGFQAQEIANFLISKKLKSPSLILLDLMIPFRRPLSAFLTVTEPLSSLVLGETTAERIVSFSRGENSLSELKEALERGEE